MKQLMSTIAPFLGRADVEAVNVRIYSERDGSHSVTIGVVQGDPDALLKKSREMKPLSLKYNTDSHDDVMQSIGDWKDETSNHLSNIAEVVADYIEREAEVKASASGKKAKKPAKPTGPKIMDAAQALADEHELDVQALLKSKDISPTKAGSVTKGIIEGYLNTQADEEADAKLSKLGGSSFGAKEEKPEEETPKVSVPVIPPRQEPKEDGNGLFGLEGLDL
jgi:hypothetical protein